MADFQELLEGVIAEHGTGYVVDVLASAIARAALVAQRGLTPIEISVTRLADDAAAEAAAPGA